MEHRSTERGFTLIESLLAIAILGIALVGMLPSMLTFADSNLRAEERSEAVAIAQEVMEALRQQPTETLLDTGDATVEIFLMGEREYEVEQHFCSIESYCSDNSRHVVVEVTYGGETVYELETVFTALR
jgi:prepilin-type N-terminal cleavage/methylation domain-containing protein